MQAVNGEGSRLLVITVAKLSSYIAEARNSVSPGQSHFEANMFFLARVNSVCLDAV